MKLLILGLMFLGTIILAQNREHRDYIDTMQRQTLLIDNSPRIATRPMDVSYTADHTVTGANNVKLTGNVRIMTQTFILSADSAEYRKDTGEILPTGNVRVRLLTRK
jgi:lipopolysaccharide assembly outer membrane protein LptD (OstA)